MNVNGLLNNKSVALGVSCAWAKTWGRVLILSNSKHPADEIARALLRAGGILSSLTTCYDSDNGSFDVGDGFVFEALRNVERMVMEAQNSLQLLHDEYDIRPDAVAEFEDAQLAEFHAMTGTGPRGLHPNGSLSAAQHLSANSNELVHGDLNRGSVKQMPFTDLQQSSQQLMRLSDRLDEILERYPREEPQVKVAEPAEGYARTYVEFLDKLMAMADAAATEAHVTGNSGGELAPVLDGLRADVRRLRAVA